MKASEILGIGPLRFIEPSFADLPDSSFNRILADLPGDSALLLIDEREDPLALAFHDNGIWVGSTFICRKPSVSAIGHFEEIGGEIYQEDRSVWTGAVREYYSLEIAEQVSPALEDLNKDRITILKDLLETTWGTGNGTPCIDFCCGSGVGSHVLRALGYRPLSCDNDPALISLGLSSGRLRPEETICIDATIASRYIDPFPRGIGIMMGEINNFSTELWQQLVTELFSVADKTLITTGTEPEAVLIRSWAEEQPRTAEIFENPKDPIYDRWVYIGNR